MKLCRLLMGIFLFAFGIPCSHAQTHLFNYYKAIVYKGYKAKPIIKGNRLAEHYKTAINNTYYAKLSANKFHKTGLNFAGHYCFVWWGCGSPCQDSAIVDLKTGIIYQGPTAALGYRFKNDSRLLVVNPGTVIGDCAFCDSEYWVWNETQKKLKRVK